MSREVVSTFEVADKPVEIFRIKEMGETFYEAMAPDGHCWMDESGGLMWGLIGHSSASCRSRVQSSQLLRCDNEACLVSDEAEILTANGI